MYKCVLDFSFYCGIRGEGIEKAFPLYSLTLRSKYLTQRIKVKALLEFQSHWNERKRKCMKRAKMI